MIRANVLVSDISVYTSLGGSRDGNGMWGLAGTYRIRMGLLHSFSGVDVEGRALGPDLTWDDALVPKPHLLLSEARDLAS